MTRSLAGEMRAGLSSHRDNIALTFLDGEPFQARQWTYGELAGAIAQHVSTLRALVRPGRPVCVVTTTRPESVAALLAAQELTHPVLLLPASLPAIELRAALDTASVDCAFVPPGAEGVLGARTWGWNRIHSHYVDRNTPIAGRDIFTVQLTSGSLGPSRLAARTSDGVRREIDAVSERLDLGNSPCRVLCASSISHSYGLIGGVLVPLHQGGQVILARDARQALFFLQEVLSVDVMFGLASTYQSLVMQTSTSRQTVPPRLALCAGAPLPIEIFRAYLRRFGQPIHQDYGTTETGTICIDTGASVRPGCVGLPLSHIQLRVVEPPSSGHTTGSGEIQVRAPAVAAGYLEKEALESCIDSDGWYHTGDLGQVDDEGKVSLDGRIRNPIPTSVSLAHPERIEQVIARLPGVREVIVLPVMESTGTTQIKAVIAGASLRESDVVHWCSIYLPPDHIPAIVQIVDELPRSPAGKILQKYLG